MGREWHVYTCTRLTQSQTRTESYLDVLTFHSCSLLFSSVRSREHQGEWRRPWRSPCSFTSSSSHRRPLLPSARPKPSIPGRGSSDLSRSKRSRRALIARNHRHSLLRFFFFLSSFWCDWLSSYRRRWAGAVAPTPWRLRPAAPPFAIPTTGSALLLVTHTVMRSFSAFCFLNRKIDFCIY